MQFDFVKKVYDSLNEDIFNSAFTINATVHILAEEVAQESFYPGYGDVLDGRQTDIIKKKYPADLNKYYRIKVLPIEKSGLRLVDLANNKQIQYTASGNVEPFDFWISCMKEKAIVRTDKTMFDFSDEVEIKGVSYIIKGLVEEDFGYKTIIHVFLSKETES